LTTPSRGSWLAAFQIRNFRFQWPADLATGWAFEMETLILGWYVLVETESVLLLTLFGSLQYLGTLISPLFGVAGDRIGHRNLLCLMRATYALLASILMVLALTGTLRPLYVFAVTLVSGLVRPSDLAMRNSIIGETVPAHQLMAAMSISRTTNDSARIAGALAGAGLVATLGLGPAYIGIALFYGISLLLTLQIHASGRSYEGRASPWRDLREGVAYVWNTPHFRATLALALLVNVTAYPITGSVLAYVVRDIYEAGQTGLGYLVASFSTGAVVGSLMLGMKGGLLRPARMMLAYSIGWHAALLVFAQLETLPSGVAILCIAGFMQSLCMVPMSVMLLRTSDPRFRGRLMGVRMMAVYGMPIGLLAGGPIIDVFGFMPMATAYSLAGIGLTLLIAVRWRHLLWDKEAPANAR
jgi:MFS family permease